VPIVNFLKNTNFKAFRYDNDVVPDDIGAYPSVNVSQLIEVGPLLGRITTGDSLEPDILGTVKEAMQDVSSMYIGFFDIPSSFELHTGDYIQDVDDHARYYQVQFLDKYPGGVPNHHIEARLQTTEIVRNAQ
jgi:hypothetical protein